MIEMEIKRISKSYCDSCGCTIARKEVVIECDDDDVQMILDKLGVKL